MHGRRYLRATVFGAFLAVGFGGTTSVRADFDANGWIIDWLIFGPLQALNGAPGVNVIRLDYIADGDTVYEATMLPEEGEEVSPDFLGASASTGFHAVVAEPVSWKPVNLPSVAGAPANTFDLLSYFSPGGVIDNVMVYGVVYVENPGLTDVAAAVQLGSDDSIQVKVDDCEVFIHNGGRGYDDGAVNGVQDTSTPFTITPGVHRIVVKNFNGGGPAGFRLRLSDPATGNPLTNLTTPALNVSLDPSGVTSIQPFGVSVERTSIVPFQVVGLTKTPLVTLAVAKTYPALSDATVITIREILPAMCSLNPGSASPAEKSYVGGVITWELALGDAVANGITYELKLDAPGTGCLAGDVSVAGVTACTLSTQAADPITGTCIYAAPLNAIYLGDIVGGGTGKGDKDPSIWAVNTDTGIFMTEAEVRAQNLDTVDTDGVNPALCEDTNWPGSEYIDVVFFMNTQTLAINSEGVQFTFDANDVHTGSYNHILSNLTNDIDKSPGNMLAGGKTYVTGVGIHASSGVTFDLSALRFEYGAEKIVNLLVVLGTDNCGAGAAGNNTVTLYVIYSTDQDILDAETVKWQSTSRPGSTGANEAFEFKGLIPEDALYLTFATGRLDAGIGCDHGVFAEARIFPELPTARFTADPLFGGPPLAVNFDASTSTPPPGATLTKYEWDFGDGQTGTGVTVSHTYQTRGRFTAALTVTDSAGTTDTRTLEIQALFKSCDVSPWTSKDLGAPVIHGGACDDTGCMQVFGGGKGTVQRSDELQFVYQPKSGDQILTARLDSAVYETLGRGGLMIRESLDVDSAMAFITAAPILTGSYRATFYARPAKGDLLTTRNANTTFLPPDLRMKIERVGNECIGSVSGDGIAWTEVGRVTLVSPPAEMLIGPAVSGLDAAAVGNAATLTFCDLTFGGAPPVETICDDKIDNDGDGDTDCADSDCASATNCQGTQFRRGDADAKGGVPNITDGIFVLNFLFLGGAEPPCKEAANADDKGDINITDGIYILNYLFQGGPAPPAPGPDNCGPEPPDSPDNVGCITYDKC